MDKKPRRMDFAEYIMEIQHTHTWFYPDEVLPPINEIVIVKTKEALFYQCAFYIDPEDIFFDDDILESTVFFDEEGKPHVKSKDIEKGFYIELPVGAKSPRYQKVSVIRWTDCPSIGVKIESMNVMHALRQYFRQAGRTGVAKKKIMQLVKEVYAEKPVNWEKSKNDKS